MKTAGLAGLAVAGLLAACAGAPRPPLDADAPRHGYLSDEAKADLAAGVAPRPVAGSLEDMADHAASERMRALDGGERWLLATLHAEVRPPLGQQSFDCALGVRFGAEPTPKLDALMTRVLLDANDVAERVKAANPRLRPIGEDRERRACQTIDAAARSSDSYPSGTAAVAAAYGETLSALAPDHADAVRASANQIALSRVVCAMHYPSDVTGGEAVGRVVMSRLVADPAYQADLLAAKAEIDAARARNQTSPACAAERSAYRVPLP
ncbi:PA-phosphatase [Brevundimonas sp. Leaf363]|uniref:phosphatase PAP2 family protein n=1 Tax=Brevundimonas sp. Leaf363 TaxID=1736353 RepID=UPI0006FDFAEE|nr:phosphatase PAP2 family protein [Brevundimonas sp. Leaf363]KQS52916.1 PA-phosphatase [Brevundimonas sp. Leaf363]